MLGRMLNHLGWRILTMRWVRLRISFLVGTREGYRADALIVDPPRTGLDDKLLKTILAYTPKKMVYVSCNVSTLARDPSFFG